MVIHTFGDSHSYTGWCTIPNISIHVLGPKLCYSISRDGIDIKDGYNVSDGDIVIFCFGEIDCRCHVNKHITDGNSYTQIIDNIVDGYFSQIKIAVDKFNNIKTAIYNVVPPKQQSRTFENPEFPFLGSDAERKAYVLYFNQRLSEKCIEYNFVFFDIYNKYLDTNGFLNRRLSDGNVHITSGFYLEEFIKNNFDYKY